MVLVILTNGFAQVSKISIEESLKLKKYIEELKKRNVFKVAVTYGVAAWLLLQIAGTVVPIIDAPKWLLKVVLILLIIGFPISLIFAWAYEMTPQGIKKTNEVKKEVYGSKKMINNYSKLIIFILLLGLSVFLAKLLWKSESIEVEAIVPVEKKASKVKQVELTSNLEALDYYLKGEFHQKKETSSEVDTAIVYYIKAIELDPKFAKAYNNLASAYMRKYLFHDPDTKWEEEAYSAAGKALIINPNLANPHLIKGQFYWSESHNFAHEEAFNEFVKAIEKDPEFSEAYDQLALVQLHMGLFEEALKNAYTSIELDPGNFKARQFIGETLLFQGSYIVALREFDKIPENFSNQHTQSLKVLNYFYLNQVEKAIEILDDYLINNPNSPNLNSVYAIVLANEGRIMEAKEKREIVLKNSKNFIHAHHIYYHLGVAAALMNEKQEAIDWLEKAAETGFPNYPLFSSDPNLISLRGSEKYEELLSKLKKKWEYFKTL